MKKFITIFLILISFTSCKLTTSLWEDSYEESIRSFLISADGKYVAFLGTDYDYIFIDYSGDIRSTFFWQNSTIVTVDPTKSYFGVNSNNQIDATLTVRAPRVGVTQEDAAYLRSIRFTDEKNGSLQKKIKLQGRRYLANKSNSNYAGYYSLTTPYRIKINRVGFSSRSAVLAARNIVLTPITMTLDSILLFGQLLSETDI